MPDPATLTLDVLSRAVAGGAAALRAVTRLQPAGGPGDKVFPPTYVKEGRATTKYAFEQRRVDGQELPVVLLDSVASQANRMEEALAEAHAEGLLRFPLLTVDFSGEDGLADLDQISALQAPHRAADALLRDSLLDGQPFRKSTPGLAITEARPGHATGMYRYCPTALIFGIWDSTGPKGGLGAKFQRALVSEIVGVNAVAGTKVGSRIDPAGIQANVPVYARKDDESDWTIVEAEAKTVKGKPVEFSRKGAEGKGKPSAINHSNVAPTLDVEAGGVTLDYALQTVVLSLPALRRLRFVEDVAGRPLPRERRPKAERAARTALAALAVAGVVEARDRGFDLRSRSLLVAEGPLELELLPGDGGEVRRYRLDVAGARALVAEAVAAAEAEGMGWSAEPIRMVPAPKLADLIRASRARASAGEDEASE